MTTETSQRGALSFGRFTPDEAEFGKGGGYCAVRLNGELVADLNCRRSDDGGFTFTFQALADDKVFGKLERQNNGQPWMANASKRDGLRRAKTHAAITLGVGWRPRRRRPSVVDGLSSEARVVREASTTTGEDIALVDDPTLRPPRFFMANHAARRICFECDAIYTGHLRCPLCDGGFGEPVTETETETTKEG